ncbi:GtrA family protein [Beijerinckia indica subsp. indica ATCC 9039]|uniref:GtrA family protein n=2 Tax=Beijerinckia TaxID=532 RepID=B2IB17_BEII9|nr:GtrA family protein [Beijerinckia indica]ACB93717.1 GtrA family protein [Beijerinckia indica subsp. indica ATCC 9039]
MVISLRQFSTFAGVGLCAAVVHYGLLIVLVEAMGVDVIIATLVGYCGGGICSYWLNRRHTFQSERRHREAIWRFILVAAVGFGLTWLCMLGLVRGLKIPYLLAQALTTGIVMVWSYGAHKVWTFGLPKPQEGA